MKKLSGSGKETSRIIHFAVCRLLSHMYWLRIKDAKCVEMDDEVSQLMEDLFPGIDIQSTKNEEVASVLMLYGITRRDPYDSFKHWSVLEEAGLEKNVTEAVEMLPGHTVVLNYVVDNFISKL